MDGSKVFCYILGKNRKKNLKYVQTDDPFVSNQKENKWG